MTGAKRAGDLHVGDVLPDGAVVYRITPSARGLNIRARRPDGTAKLMRYRPSTFLPTPSGELPSRFETGHPWTRKGIYRRKQQR